ncbi:MAG TPA: archaellum operon transcriptional activator EarA family protein [Candidatus Thermoplasmatota archaeon]|nr:archaellum operon transcriptional activator EarA family protein [Candidatus Thermoplasmatota archaeon]
MLGPDAREIAESFRRGPRRGDLLLELDAHRIASTSHLAAAVGITATRVVYMMHGRLPYYRHDQSLVRLGLARRLKVRRGRAYEITPLGERVARILAEERRRDERAESERRWHTRRLRRER